MMIREEWTVTNKCEGAFWLTLQWVGVIVLLVFQFQYNSKEDTTRLLWLSAIDCSACIGESNQWNLTHALSNSVISNVIHWKSLSKIFPGYQN